MILKKPLLKCLKLALKSKKKLIICTNYYKKTSEFKILKIVSLNQAKN